MAFDFPDSPSLNQVYASYTWDGEKWISTVGGTPMPVPTVDSYTVTYVSQRTF